MSFKFDCKHGRHETVADAKACQANASPAPTALDKLSTQHIRNDLAMATARSEQVRRSVLGTPAQSNPLGVTAEIQAKAPRDDAPAGYYAIGPEGDTKFYKVDRPTEG